MRPCDGSTIYYVGAFRFPDGNAGGQRVRGIGNCLRDGGFKAVFLGSEVAGESQHSFPNGGFEYDGFEYYPAGNAGTSPARRLWRLWHTHLSGLSAIGRLKRLWHTGAVAVIAYQPSYLLLVQLRRFCSHHRIAMIGDVVEWYDRRHVLGGPFGPFALDLELGRRYMRARADGVCAISSFLEGFFRRDGRPTVRVPALVDTRASCWRCTETDRAPAGPLRLAFVGSAARKDLLVNAIRGLARLEASARKCELAIVGPSKSEIALNLGKDAELLERMRDHLCFTGSLPHQEALSHLAQADFSIILRPDQRFAHAGFPTKLVESLAMGVPVICNLTGDMRLYVRDGQEGLVVKDCSPEAFASGLRRALALSREQRRAMRASARQRAQVSLDYRNWVEPLAGFMRQVIGRRQQGRR